MDAISVPIQRSDSRFEAPRQAKPGDAGLDLCSAEDLVLAPGERAVVSCGIRAAIPEGHAGLVVPRSGLAARHGITIVNAPGLIDSGYRGDIKAVLLNTDAHEAFAIAAGDRIAQLVIIRTPEVHLEEVDELAATERGDTGFGSSGI